jgi:hypothetical protein
VERDRHSTLASLLVLTYSLTHLLTRPWLGSTSPLTMLWWSRSSTSRSRSPLRVSGAGRLLQCLFVCAACLPACLPACLRALHWKESFPVVVLGSQYLDMPIVCVSMCDSVVMCDDVCRVWCLIYCFVFLFFLSYRVFQLPHAQC